jgi:hypothetical protein
LLDLERRSEHDAAILPGDGALARTAHARPASAARSLRNPALL